MKKLLLLSALVLFGCSKDSMVSTDSGNKIIGNYQILQTSPEYDEFCFWGNFYSENTKGHELFSYWESISITNVRGTINFSSDSKGYYDITVEDENIRVNFNWSFDGTKWSVADSNSNSWQISYCNSLYIMNSRSDGGKISYYNYRLIF
ncbi:MAG: hypothetical protein P8I75_02065 [Flavobacteriaceae bacterium]|nr:hypothetical protein [Flavobacteriaceae bacterium]